MVKLISLVTDRKLLSMSLLGHLLYTIDNVNYLTVAFTEKLEMIMLTLYNIV